MHTPVRARTRQMLQKLNKYKVNPNLMDKSIHFDQYEANAGNYKKVMRQNIASQFYQGSKKSFHFEYKIRRKSELGPYPEEPSHGGLVNESFSHHPTQNQTFSYGPQTAGSVENPIDDGFARNNTQSNHKDRKTRNLEVEYQRQ